MSAIRPFSTFAQAMRLATTHRETAPLHPVQSDDDKIQTAYQQVLTALPSSVEEERAIKAIDKCDLSTASYATLQMLCEDVRRADNPRAETLAYAMITWSILADTETRNDKLFFVLEQFGMKFEDRTKFYHPTLDRIVPEIAKLLECKHVMEQLIKTVSEHPEQYPVQTKLASHKSIGRMKSAFLQRLTA